MKHPRIAVLFVCILWICTTGCGGNPRPIPPVGNACTGVVISGVMQDSLTNQPVSQGWAVLESGTQLSTTPIFNFSQSQKVTSDVHGSFSLCSSAVTQPSAVVLVALDSSGNAYPAFVTSASGAADLGTIPMGGCRVLCGFEGEQQTSSPATINGTITSAPVAKSGTVMAQYAMNALDGSKNIWNFAMPSLDPAQGNTFNATPGVCAGNAPYCATYTFTVPSQKPVQQVTGGYRQESGAPTYSIYAVVDDPPSCHPSFGHTILQQDGTSFLTGGAGEHLSAADIKFTGCQ